MAGLRIAAGIVLTTFFALSMVILILFAILGGSIGDIYLVLILFQVLGSGVAGILLLIDGIRSD